MSIKAGELQGGRRDRLPLPGDVDQALADYLLKARRPSSCRSAFLQAVDPPVGMSRNAVVFVSRTASARAGIAVVGGHRLRHTVGTELLRHGASLREVGEVLRQERSDDDLDLCQGRRALAALGGPAVAGEVSAMISFDEHLDRYLAVRRSLGYRLQEHGRVLPDFVRYAHARGETTVRTQTALAWAGGAGSEGERGRRLSMVRGLARYLAALDARTEIPPSGLLADGRVRLTPHIYSEQEIARLMRAAWALAPAPLGAAIATLIGLMATNGLRPGETRRLERRDVDLAGGQLTVWHSKLGRSRRLPLHESTVQALADYSIGRDRAHPHPPDQAFFLGRRGCRLTRPVLSAAFRELRQQASITTPAGQRPALLGICATPSP